MQRFSSTGPATSPATVGEAENVSKSFGETRALVDVSLTVQPGECHALVGRNGAGKSTLVTLFTGLNRPDRGAIRLAGEAAPSLADRGAWLARVACVYQRSMVVPPLTVAENVFLNRPVEGERAVINWRRMRAEAHELMLEWGFDIDVDQEAATLTVEQRQIVEIARALSIGARFLILDEPTAALEKAAVDRLFERVRRLREGGVGVLYISHHLEEIYEICQRVSVLRDGELVLSGRVGDISQAKLVAAMVGSAPPRRATEIEAVRVDSLGGTKLEVKQLTVASRGGSVIDVDLSVRAGECVGLVGLRGSGTATVADAVVGLIKPRRGSIAIDGSPVPVGSVHATLRRGVGYVPQDRPTRAGSRPSSAWTRISHMRCWTGLPTGSVSSLLGGARGSRRRRHRSSRSWPAAWIILCRASAAETSRRSSSGAPWLQNPPCWSRSTRQLASTWRRRRLRWTRSDAPATKELPSCSFLTISKTCGSARGSS